MSSLHPMTKHDPKHHSMPLQFNINYKQNSLQVNLDLSILYQPRLLRLGLFPRTYLDSWPSAGGRSGRAGGCRRPCGRRGSCRSCKPWPQRSSASQRCSTP